MHLINKTLLSIWLMAGWQLAFGQSVFKLKGTFDQVNEGTKIYLSYAKTGIKFRTDSAEIKGQQFEISVTAEKPMIGSVFFSKDLAHGNRDELKLVIANGEEVTLKGRDSLKNATAALSGEMNELYRSYLKDIEPTMRKLRFAFKDVYNDGSTREQYNERMTQYLAVYNLQYPKKLKMGTDYVKAHPHAYVSLLILNENLGGYLEVDRVAPAYDQLSTDIKSSPEGLILGKKIDDARNLNIGTMAPLFTAKNPTGKDINLADYRGKYVLVDFWASWCGPCRAENPALLKTYAKFKTRNFEVLGTSIDTEKNKSAWLKAIADDGMPWQQVIIGDQRSPIAKMYRIEAVPMNFLLDPNGKIVAKNLRGDALENALIKFIK